MVDLHPRVQAILDRRAAKAAEKAAEGIPRHQEQEDVREPFEAPFVPPTEENVVIDNMEEDE